MKQASEQYTRAKRTEAEEAFVTGECKHDGREGAACANATGHKRMDVQIDTARDLRHVACGMLRVACGVWRDVYGVWCVVLRSLCVRDLAWEGCGEERVIRSIERVSTKGVLHATLPVRA